MLTKMMWCFRRVALTMIEQRTVIFAMLLAIATARHANQGHNIHCGKQVFREPSGVIKSPLFPKNITCEWYIVAKPGNRIEMAIQTYIDPVYGYLSGAYDDYILVLDANDSPGREEITLRDAYGDINYRSKHNIVIIEFMPKKSEGSEGFLISYGTWDIHEHCSTDQLYTNDLSCTGNASAEHYFSACEISSCYRHFDLRATSINCVNGSFIPQFPCELNEKIVEECYTTGLERCPYREDSLVEYVRRKEELLDHTEVCETVDGEQRNCMNIEAFPDFEAPIKCPICGVGTIVGCKSELWNYSYCVRSSSNPSKYLLDCRRFSKIRSLGTYQAQMHMRACYACQRIGCRRSIYL